MLNEQSCSITADKEIAGHNLRKSPYLFPALEKRELG